MGSESSFQHPYSCLIHLDVPKPHQLSLLLPGLQLPGTDEAISMLQSLGARHQSHSDFIDEDMETQRPCPGLPQL